MRLPLLTLCVVAATLTPAWPAVAEDPACTQVGWTDPVTGTHELFPPCTPDDHPLTCAGPWVGPVVGGPLAGTEAHVWVCLPKQTGPAMLVP